jgi:hypothetical protein
MRRLSRIGIAIIVAVDMASAAIRASTPTVAVFDGTSCPAGVYAISATASDLLGHNYPSLPISVALPAAQVSVPWPNLPPGQYSVLARAQHADGRTWNSQIETVTGLGDPLPPDPTPTPVQDSPDCTKGPTVTIGGHVFTLDTAGLVLQDGASTNGHGTALKAVGGVLHTAAKVDPPNWYRLEGGTWKLDGPAEPACGTPATTTAVDLSPVLSAIAALKDAILAALAPPPPPQTVTCTVNSIGTNYADGSQRLTAVKCPAGSFVVGQTIKVIK